VFVAEGILALEDKKYDEALEGFRRALQREPGHVEALYYAGVALMAQNKAAEAAPLLERARRISPEEMAVAYQLGLAYFSLNRYDEAQVVLEHVFRRDPGLDSLGYYVGYLRYRKGDHQGALQAFRAGRTTDPNIAQLTRFYTGLALNAMGMSRQAAAEVEQALRLQPASPLAGPAERLRQSFAESRDAERRLHASLRLGGFFDDNVNARPSAHPSSDTVNALRRPENQSWGELASLRLEYDWLKTGPWTSTVGYSFFTTYNNRLPSFNIIDHLGTVTVSRQDLLGSMPLISSVQYAYEYLMLGGTELLSPRGLDLLDARRGTPQPDQRHLQGGSEEFRRERPGRLRAVPGRQQLHAGPAPRLSVRPGPSPAQARASVRLRICPGLQLRLSRQSLHRGSAVHTALVQRAADLRLQSPPAQLPEQEHALSRGRPRHPQASGRRVHAPAPGGSPGRRRVHSGRRLPGHQPAIESRPVHVHPKHLHTVGVLYVLSRC